MLHGSHVWEKNAEAVAFVGKELVFPFPPSPAHNLPHKVLHYIMSFLCFAVFNRK